MAFTTIKHDTYETGMVHDQREMFLIDTEADVAELPTDSAPGSIAYTADHTMAWQMSPSKVWTKVVNVPALLDKFKG